MKNYIIFGIVILGICGVINTQAAQITVQAADTTHLMNCIAFGCPGSNDPHMGFIYKNIDAFSVSAGDTISFDLYGENDKELNFDISFAHTLSNGGNVADANGFTTVVSNGIGTGRGNLIIGDYDLTYTFTSGYTFTGGGLIIDFLTRGVSETDFTGTPNLVGARYSTDSSQKFVERYYAAASAGAGAHDPYYISNFQIQTSGQGPNVPVPAAIWLMGSGLIGIMGLSRKKKTTITAYLHAANV